MSRHLESILTKAGRVQIRGRGRGLFLTPALELVVQEEASPPADAACLVTGSNKDAPHTMTEADAENARGWLPTWAQDLKLEVDW